jgi:uncharacterized membrane protein SpoIIM required for sporulation
MGPSFVLSAVTTSLIASSCLFGMWLYVVYLCACLMYLSVGCLVVSSQYHIPNKQLDDANKQRSSNSTKHERQPLEDGQTIVTKTYRVLMMCFKKYLKFSILNVNVNVF